VLTLHYQISSNYNFSHLLSIRIDIFVAIRRRRFRSDDSNFVTGDIRIALHRLAPVELLLWQICPFWQFYAASERSICLGQPVDVIDVDVDLLQGSNERR
jgi:hypothetical protein